jgi:hypothetical protein
MINESTLRRARTITEQQGEVYGGKDFHLPKVTGDWFYDKFMKPEVGGYQMPGVAQKMTPALSAVMYQQALERGAGPGAVSGALGGAVGGAGLGALAASSLPSKGKGLLGFGAQLAKAGAGALAGGSIGGALGAGEGFFGGRGAGASIAGGGIPTGAIAGLASIIPESGKGLRSWPALGIASAAGFLGSDILANIVKNVESTRKRLAMGGAEGSVFPMGPGANRVG